MTKKVTAYGGGLIHQGGRLRQGATLDDPSLPDLPGSARGWPRVSPLGLENGSVPHHPLTVYAALAGLPSSCHTPVRQAHLLGLWWWRTIRAPRSRPNMGARGPDVKGYLCGSYSTTEGEAWPTVWLKLGAQHVRTKTGRRTTYRCAAKIPPKETGEILQGAVQQWSRIGWDH